MKILAIRGKNLASLEKAFEVDFNEEPLKSAGIFAITGCTGSGKSTLLDALCLALFDSSPRSRYSTENIQIQDVGDATVNQRDSRNILRRGTAEGYAEVDFVSLAGETYRARWSVRRAYGKADGQLQNSEMRLLNLSKATEEQGRKNELVDKISTLIGLTFEQFTRSVLLAQGDFATFLRAKQSDKAELLEKLTGTEIYSRISAAIYEKTKVAENSLNAVNERIRGIQLLADEDVNACEIEKESVQREISALKKETEALTAQLKWIDEKDRITGEIRQAESAYTAARQAIEQAAGRYGYIKKADTAQEIRDRFQRLKDVSKKLDSEQKSLRTSITQRDENAKSLAEAESALKECEKEQELLSEQQKEVAPQIIRARELDVRIREAKANAEEANRELSAAKSLFDKTEKNIQTFKNAIKNTENALSTLNQWFAANGYYESIVSRTSLLLNLATDAATAREQAAHNAKTLESNNSLLDQNQLQLKDLQQEAGTLNSLLPAEIAVLRATLKEGIPCPVCGSLHHPTTEVDDSRRMKEQELNRAKEANTKKQEALTAEIDRRKTETTRLAAVIESYATQFDTAFKTLESNLSAIPEWKELFGRGELKDCLTKRTEQWNKNAGELAKSKEEINRHTVNLENEAGKFADASANLKARTEKFAASQKAVEQLSSDRAEVLHGKPADAAERYFVDKQNAVAEKLKKSTGNKNSYTARNESLNGAISLIQGNVELSKEQVEALNHEINKWIAEKEDFTFELLAELLSRDNAWIQAEKQMLKKIAEAETATNATLAERRKNLDRHNSLESKPENETDSKDILQNNLAAINATADEKNKRLTEITVTLSANAKSKELIKGLAKEREEKGELAENWRKLNDLLGSASGNKFKEIAQGYTLETLLSYANKHLRELSPRYRLQRIPDHLALQVTDRDMLNEVRTIHSLSGGESFLISLALALGLSSLSSNRMKVESLFIDEGFGSLDSDTLRTAMDALEHLHSQGRKIGIISHVTEMTERITVQIKIKKTTNGKSEVEVAG